MWRDYLAKSTVNLTAAKRDFEHADYDPCVNRAYFAIFHAALAALIVLSDYRKRGKHWNHGDVAAQFVRGLIRRRKVLSRSQADILDELRALRHEADYNFVRTSRTNARQSLNRARSLIRQIKAVVPAERES